VGNFPFATIDPTSTLLAIPDPRLRQLTTLSSSAKETPCFVEIVDIAGLVRGASEGRGLGNAFLANIGAVQSILHVVRAFDDSSIEHVEGAVDPVRDLALIKEELALRDLSLLDHRAKARRAPPAEVDLARALMPLCWRAGKDVHAFVDAIAARAARHCRHVWPALHQEESGAAQRRRGGLAWQSSTPKRFCGTRPPRSSAASSRPRSPISTTPPPRLKCSQHMASRRLRSRLSHGTPSSCSTAAVFYTTGDTESRAWLFKRGTIARECAGLIHTSFVKNFVRAEVRSFADALANKTARIEGPNYVHAEQRCRIFSNFTMIVDRRLSIHLRASCEAVGDDDGDELGDARGDALGDVHVVIHPN
jgi:hypothetical protein